MHFDDNSINFKNIVHNSAISNMFVRILKEQSIRAKSIHQYHFRMSSYIERKYKKYLQLQPTREQRRRGRTTTIDNMARSVLLRMKRLSWRLRIKEDPHQYPSYSDYVPSLLLPLAKKLYTVATKFCEEKRGTGLGRGTY